MDMRQYLDMNGVIHNCSHGAGTDTNTRMSEEEMMQKVFAYIDHLFRMVRPKRLLYMAIDGVAPRAKMNQQRSRRFRSAKEVEEARAEALAKGEPVADGEAFDSNCITPGTEFMARLTEHLKFYVRKKQTEDVAWRHVKVVLSGHEVRGEGEHKIMEHIRWARLKPDYDANMSHCLYGLDADLIMLALVTHEPHFCLLREVVKFGGGEKGQPSREILERPSDEGFLMLQVGLLREYFDLEFQNIGKALGGFKYDVERIIDDIVFLCMLVGNDFLPPLPTLDIAEGALNTLFDTYRDMLPSLGGYITGDNGGGTFNAPRLETILTRMASYERDVLEQRALDVQEFEEKQSRKNNKGNKNGGSSSSYDESATDLTAMEQFEAELLKAKEEGKPEPTMMSVAKRNAILDGGAQGLEQYKEMYYREKLELEIGDPAPVQGLRQAYFEGLNWVLRYYYRGVASWTWYYPYHYAPMASDLCAGLGQLTVKFDYGRPFYPFEQLMAVQPPASSHLLPEQFRHFMTADSSPLKEFFPDEIKLDFEGKRNSWEGVVLLPFLDEKKLRDAIASVPKEKLTDAQNKRNAPGDCIIFVRDENCTDAVNSTVPKAFSGLFPAKSTMSFEKPPGEFPDDKKCLGGKDSLLPGLKIDTIADYPRGFPTFQSVEIIRGDLKHAKCVVFQAPTKKESLIIKIGSGSSDFIQRALPNVADKNSTILTTEAVAKTYLSERVYVKWPYLKESLVVGVSDQKSKYVVGPGKSIISKPHDSSQFHADVTKVSGDLMRTQGVDCSNTRITLHVRACEGLVRHPDGTLQKRFAKTEVDVPMQLCLEAHPRDKSEAEAAKDLGIGENDDMKVTWRAGDEALFLGRSHFGSYAKVVSKDARTGNLFVDIEPMKLDTGIGRRILQGVAQRFESAGQIARKLGIEPKVMGQITSAVWTRLTKDAGKNERVDVGLNLRKSSEDLCVAGYSRKGEKGWEYSLDAQRLISEYKKHHPWIFEALRNDAGESSGGVITMETLFESHDLNTNTHLVAEAKKWLKSQPASRRPLVPADSVVAAEEAVRALAAAIGDQSSNYKQPTPVSLEGVSPLLLMKPVIPGEVIDLYAGGDFELGDRVAYVGDSGTPPFCSRGTVVSIHGYTDAHTTHTVAEHVEIMFDGTFVGGTDLRGTLPDNRGAMVAVSSVVNLSHPPAMPSLGKAAPDIVKKVESLSLEDVMNLNWKGGSENVKKLATEEAAAEAKAVLAPSNQKQPTLPGEKGFAKSAGRGRGISMAVGSNNNNQSKPVKTLGALEQIQLLEQKAREEKQAAKQQSQQPTTTTTTSTSNKPQPPPPAKKKGILGSLKDMIKKAGPPPLKQSSNDAKPPAPAAATSGVSSLADLEAKIVTNNNNNNNNNNKIAPPPPAVASSSLADLEAKLSQQARALPVQNGGDGGASSLQALEAKLLSQGSASAPRLPQQQQQQQQAPKQPPLPQQQKPKKTGWAPVTNVQPINVMSGKPTTTTTTTTMTPTPPTKPFEAPLPSKPLEASKAKPSFVPRSAAKSMSRKPPQLQQQQQQPLKKPAVDELHL